MRGFDVEVAEAIAQGLGRHAAVRPGRLTVDRPVGRARRLRHRHERRRGHAGAPRRARGHGPVLRVPRGADRPRRRRGPVPLARRPRGRRVGTLGGTLAYEMLLAARARARPRPGLLRRRRPPVPDLADGRLDAVLLDHIIAARARGATPGLATQPEPVATGHYVGVLAPANAALRDRIDAPAGTRCATARLERISAEWDIWDDDQAALFGAKRARQAARPSAASDASEPTRHRLLCARNAPLPPGALPRRAHHDRALVPVDGARGVRRRRGSRAGRIYGGRACSRALLTAYVEVTRGTPVLLQLFVLYYGLVGGRPAARVRRGAARPRPQLRGLRERDLPRRARGGAAGQLEAARTLGLTERQVAAARPRRRRRSGSRSRR